MVGGNLKAVWGASSKDVWTVGRSSIFHWDGADWEHVAVELTCDLQDVWGTSPSDVWAVGGSCVMHYDGVSWLPYSGGEDLYLNSIWGTASNDLWAANSVEALHWDGAWTHVPVGAYGIEKIRGAGEDLWVFGSDGAVLHRKR